MLSNLIILLGLDESELDEAMKAKLNLIISGATARQISATPRSCTMNASAPLS